MYRGRKDMVLINIITWAFAGMLATLVAVWLYAVVWMIYSIVRGE